MSMERNFYIADTHFGHRNILGYDDRPFFSTKEMEEEMAGWWNAAVGPGDTVYILGDFCWQGEEEWARLLTSLNGKKVLIRGNHDHPKLTSRVAQQFDQIADYLEINDGGRHVVLSHYPIPCFKNHFHGWYHLYGHVHNSFEANMMEYDKRLLRDLYERECRMYNVGCMMPWMNYTPRTLDEVLTRYDEVNRHE